MAYSNNSTLVTYERKSTLEFITDLLNKYDKNQEWYIYGGYVRNILIGIVLHFIYLIMSRLVTNTFDNCLDNNTPV